MCVCLFVCMRVYVYVCVCVCVCVCVSESICVCILTEVSQHGHDYAIIVTENVDLFNIFFLQNVPQDIKSDRQKLIIRQKVKTKSNFLSKKFYY